MEFQKKVWIFGVSSLKKFIADGFWYPKIVHHLWSTKKYNGLCTLCVAIVPLALLAFFARRERILHLLIFKWLKLLICILNSTLLGVGECRAKNALLTSKSKGVSNSVFSASKMNQLQNWLVFDYIITVKYEIIRCKRKIVKKQIWIFSLGGVF